VDTKIVLESFYYLSKKMNASIDKLAAIKLLFFADRYHLRKYGRLITEDTYYALPHGPVASNALDVVNSVLLKEHQTHLERVNNKAFKAIDEECALEYLSDSDIEALDFVIENFSQYSAWELRELSHEYPEWKRFKNTLGSSTSKREKIAMGDFFQDTNLPNDPYRVIDHTIVELSKDLYFHG